MESDLREHLTLYYQDQAWDKETLEGVLALFEASEQGHLCLKWPQPLKTELPIVYHQGHLYFERFYLLEQRIITLFNHLKEVKPTLLFKSPDLREKKLLPAQEFAINLAFTRGLSFITGGPGTGKTHTAGILIAEMLKQAEELTVAITAPTGKALGQLKKSLGKHLPEGSFEGFTLHGLLEPYRDDPLLLPYDVILVDESSMLDLELMVRLFESVKPGSRLIMMGDPFQLPPVEAGSLFADLAKIAPKAHLKQCLRAELKEIVEVAELIKSQDVEATLHFLRTTAGAVVWKESDDFNFQASEMPILTPLRKGRYGSEGLNLKALKESPQAPYPIMITRNHAGLELYNGDVGKISSLKPVPGDKAYFGDREIPALLLPSWELAWAISIHKSQGSEFDKVRICIPEGSEEHGVAALYTAVTRAKKYCEIWATEASLRKIIGTSSTRNSGLGLGFGE